MWKPLLVSAVVANTFFICITCIKVTCGSNKDGGDGNSKRCNKANEYYDSCAPTCPPQTCESIDKISHCPIQPAVCKGACRCDKGYYRNKLGECISEENCKKCTGPHEYFSCGRACDNVCATLNKQNQANCPIINIVCNPMCYCEKGYARDSNNICVPISKCPPPQCKDDERYETCPDTLCTPKTCSQLGYPSNCTYLSDTSNPSCPGKPGCICDNNKVRDCKGNCIAKEECSSCGGDPNAQSGCGINYGRLCSNYKNTNVFCPLICLVNGCDCKKGFVYDTNTKKCVLPKDCTPTCGINEVYSDCANGGCRKRKCSQPVICPHPKKCEGGCICADRYTKAENGTCIPENECPVQCNKPHEYYDDCAPTCPPQTCDSIGSVYSCPLQPAVCKGACRCEDGYYRNKNGECIPKNACETCGGDPNAVPGCGVNCGKLCSNYNKGPVPCPKICKIDGCDCKPDFVLDENIKKCVHPKECMTGMLSRRNF